MIQKKGGKSNLLFAINKDTYPQSFKLGIRSGVNWYIITRKCPETLIDQPDLFAIANELDAFFTGLKVAIDLKRNIS